MNCLKITWNHLKSVEVSKKVHLFLWMYKDAKFKL